MGTEPRINGVKNALSIDLEDWFCVHNLAQAIKRDDWDKCDLRVRANTTRILDLLDRHNVRATFFILGWVADRAPDLIREVEARGHEIGVHGYNHLLLTEITPEEFDEDLGKALEAIAKTGIKSQPIGFRAPSFSMVNATKGWALPILEKYGFQYDSSVFPIRHDRYGIPGSPRYPHVIETPAGPIREFPIATVKLSNDRVAPIGGGGYLRLLPYRYTSAGIRRLNRDENQPACIYFHPWEIDPDQPRLASGLIARLRTYTGVKGMTGKLERLLAEFEFSTLTHVCGEAERSATVIAQ